jgi:hypothetical protein
MAANTKLTFITMLEAIGEGRDTLQRESRRNAEPEAWFPVYWERWFNYLSHSTAYRIRRSCMPCVADLVENSTRWDRTLFDRLFALCKCRLSSRGVSTLDFQGVSMRRMVILKRTKGQSTTINMHEKIAHERKPLVCYK